MSCLDILKLDFHPALMCNANGSKLAGILHHSYIFDVIITFFNYDIENLNKMQKTSGLLNLPCGQQGDCYINFIYAFL